MAGSVKAHIDMHKDPQNMQHVRGPWKKGRLRAPGKAGLRFRLNKLTNKERVDWNRAGRPENIDHWCFARVNRRIALGFEREPNG